MCRAGRIRRLGTTSARARLAPKWRKGAPLGRDLEDYAISVNTSEFGRAVQVTRPVFNNSCCWILAIRAICQRAEVVHRYDVPSRVDLPNCAAVVGPAD